MLKKTKTLGYNGNYLGPVVELKKGKTITIRTVNRLSEATTSHWHGLVVPSSVDGGPHQVVKAGETKVVKFKVKQNESTLWFHPHPMGKTAEQVYKGLAGLLYVKDEKTKETMLPHKYGENDIPLILQDRKVKNRNVLEYADVEKIDGALGDTLLVNGTINPYFNVKCSQLRVRLINGPMHGTMQ
ncbi:MULTISPECIES: multicopper oxidase domain-containing protein [Exiguobacterium]|uniref:multicopper oxidase domain-containing protein n=1 Tax=Exiguobacterium TaxID=33986 RepID=UPI001BEB308D|nr:MULTISPECIES: multicopper oxidase domain-containing protein [unclassified Exiguobacterium]